MKRTKIAKSETLFIKLNSDIVNWVIKLFIYLASVIELNEPVTM